MTSRGDLCRLLAEKSVMNDLSGAGKLSRQLAFLQRSYAIRDFHTILIRFLFVQIRSAKFAFLRNILPMNALKLLNDLAAKIGIGRLVPEADGGVHHIQWLEVHEQEKLLYGDTYNSVLDRLQCED